MVVAGRFATVVQTSDIEVGRFVYGRSYLDRRKGVPLDPVEGNLVRRQRFNGMFGAISDAAPDYWAGSSLTEHSAQRRRQRNFGT